MINSRLIAGALALALMCGSALAQTAPPWGPNASPTNNNWLAFWATKQDVGAAVTSTGVATPSVTITGTSPTLTTGTCSGSGAVGGSTAGTFVAAACAAGTFIISGLPTAPTGWNCFATDRTTTTDTLIETAATVTSATLKATTAASDVVQFACTAY